MSDLGILLIFVMVWPLLKEYYGKWFNNWKEWFMNREPRPSAKEDRCEQFINLVDRMSINQLDQFRELRSSIKQLEALCVEGINKDNAYIANLEWLVREVRDKKGRI